jgi:hypothetical protein
MDFFGFVVFLEGKLPILKLWIYGILVVYYEKVKTCFFSRHVLKLWYVTCVTTQHSRGRPNVVCNKFISFVL